MKKLTALLLAAMMLFSLAACGDKPNAENTNPPSQQTNGGTETKEPGGEKQYSQGVTDTEIKIANSAATSGAYAPWRALQRRHPGLPEHGERGRRY